MLTNDSPKNTFSFCPFSEMFSPPRDPLGVPGPWFKNLYLKSPVIFKSLSHLGLTETYVQ